MEKVLATSEFVAHATEVKACAVSPKTKSLLASGGDDCKVNIWNVSNSVSIWSLGNNKSPVEKVCFDTDELNVVSGSVSGALKVFDLNEGRLARNLGGHKVNVTSLMYHPYGEFIVSGSQDCTMKVWDVRNKTCIQTYTGHEKEVTCVRFSPDGKWVASSSKDGQLIIWDLIAGKILQTLRLQPAYARSFEFHPTDLVMAAITSARTVRLWDLETMAPLCSSSADSHTVRTMAFVPGKAQVCSATKDGLKIWAWEAATAGGAGVGGGGGGGVSLKLKGVASASWDGVCDMRVSEETEMLVGCACASNFVSSYHVSLADVIRSTGVRESLGLALADGKRAGGLSAGEKERERERERERSERPPFSVIGSPEAIARSARTTAPPPAYSYAYADADEKPSMDGDAAGFGSGPGSASPPRLSPFASRVADAKASPPHRSHLLPSGSRQGAKSVSASSAPVPAVHYHYQDRDRDGEYKSAHSGPGGLASPARSSGDRGSVGLGSSGEDPEYDFDDDELFVGKGGGKGGGKGAGQGPADGQAARGKPSSRSGGDFKSHSGGESKATAVDMATSMSDSFLRVQLGQGLDSQAHTPAAVAVVEQHQLQPGPVKYSASACEAHLDRLLAQAPAFTSMLSNRLVYLRMLRRHWEKGELADAIDSLCNIHESSRHDPLQLCLLADFLNAVELRGNGLCLDSAVRLLPLLDGMLREASDLTAQGGVVGGGGAGLAAAVGTGGAGSEHVVHASLRGLVSLCDAFGDLIKSTRSHYGAAGGAGGVDLTREERLGKCNLCHAILLRIRQQCGGLRSTYRKSRKICDSLERFERLVSDL